MNGVACYFSSGMVKSKLVKMKKKEFNSNPASQKRPRQQIGDFFCLRHLEVQQNKPGICPKCGEGLRLKNKLPIQALLNKYFYSITW